MEDRIFKSLQAVHSRRPSVPAPVPAVPAPLAPFLRARITAKKLATAASVPAIADASRNVSVTGTVILSLLISLALFTLHVFLKPPASTVVEAGAKSMDGERLVSRAGESGRDEELSSARGESPPVRSTKRQRASRSFVLDDNSKVTEKLFPSDGAASGAAHSQLDNADSAVKDPSADSSSPEGNRLALSEVSKPASAATAFPETTPTQVPRPRLHRTSAEGSNASRSAERVYPLFDPPKDGAAQTQHALGAEDSSAVIQPGESRQGKKVDLADWNSSQKRPAAVAPLGTGDLAGSGPQQGASDSGGLLILPGRRGEGTPGRTSAATASAAAISEPAFPASATVTDPAKGVIPRPPAAPMQLAAAVASPASPAAPAAPATPSRRLAPLTTRDPAKVMSFDFENAPWGTVLSLYAAKAGLELRMDAVPPGVFNYRDSARYTPEQVLAILNVFLGPRGYRVSTEGRTLIVSPLVGPATTAPSGR